MHHFKKLAVVWPQEGSRTRTGLFHILGTYGVCVPYSSPHCRCTSSSSSLRSYLTIQGKGRTDEPPWPTPYLEHRWVVTITIRCWDQHHMVMVAPDHQMVYEAEPQFYKSSMSRSKSSGDKTPPIPHTVGFGERTKPVKSWSGMRDTSFSKVSKLFHGWWDQKLLKTTCSVSMDSFHRPVPCSSLKPNWFSGDDKVLRPIQFLYWLVTWGNMDQEQEVFHASLDE